MIDQKLINLNSEIDIKPEMDPSKIPLMRSYFVLEILRSEVHLIRVMCKAMLYYGRNIYSIGKLVEEYYLVFYKVGNI
jgi:hypothetical protein